MIGMKHLYGGGRCGLLSRYATGNKVFAMLILAPSESSKMEPFVPSPFIQCWIEIRDLIWNVMI